MIREASEAAYLSVAHRNTMTEHLDERAKGRYPASFSKGDRYAAFANQSYDKENDL